VYELARQGKSIAEIARICNLKRKSVRNRLRELVDEGILTEEEYEEIRRREEHQRASPSTTSTISLAWDALAPEDEPKHHAEQNKKLRAKRMDIYTAVLAVLTRAKVPLPIAELARTLDVAESEAEEAVHYLRSQGFNISIEDGLVELLRHVQPGQKIKVRLDEYTQGQWKRIGFVTDTHLGSRYAREDVLHTIYDIYAREGIKLVLHGGNIVDGYAKRINHYDLLPGLTGYTAQVEYLIDRYPRREGIETWFITGDDHEGWWIKDVGINIGEYIELKARQKGRDDLKFIGHIESDLELKAPRGCGWLKVMHPGGGTAYATSYTIQKIVESFQGGEKPHILLAGHYHKFNVDFSREVYSVQGGCVQDQTPFMRKKKLQAHVGGSIIEFHQSPTGEINRFRVEWFSFYDKKFYEHGRRFVSW
jgi:Mn-dependent DtxR family transcriptional regulator/predicted phosphodiesterase